MIKVKQGLLLSTMLMGLAACSPKLVKAPEAAPLDYAKLTAKEQAAYALGVSSANSFMQYLNETDSTLSKDLVLKGFTVSFRGEPLSLGVEDASKLFAKYMQEKEESRVAALKAEATRFLDGYAKDERYKKTESGIYYRAIEEAKGPRPTVQDTVQVQYIGKLADGTEFDNSYKRGAAATFPLLQLIPGWTEGICLMPEGSTYELIIPPHLSYGERGAGQAIPPYAPLVFQIKLEKIFPYKEVPTKVSAEKVSKKKRNKNK